MYAALYSYEKENGVRKHLGNLVDITFDYAKRAYDFDGSQVKGFCDFNINKELIFAIHQDSGALLLSGYIKNLKPENNLVSFSAEDLRKVFDTDVILDFSQTDQPDHTLKGIFARVCNAVSSNKDPFISAVRMRFMIPDDSSDTKFIADYTGRYLIVNAKQFLKTYLAFFGYYIDAYYDTSNDEIVFSFNHVDGLLEIKIKDFLHEKTSSDIKTNKVIATIAYTTQVENPYQKWGPSTLEEYTSSSNRGTIYGSLPEPANFDSGYCLRLVTSVIWTNATYQEYLHATYPIRLNVKTTYTTPQSITVEDIGIFLSPYDFNEGTVIDAYTVMNDGTVIPAHSTFKIVPQGIEFYKNDQVTYNARPTMPEKIYTLGNDNQIYEGYAPADKRIYPIVSKIFESAFMYEAQINAVSELVNNRYVENIIITNEILLNPIDLKDISLLQMVRVYDSAGVYKDMPVSEKNFKFEKNHQQVKIKLGFKKTMLTEIIKNDVGASPVVAQRGGNGNINIYSNASVWGGSEEPDSTKYSVWLKPIGRDD